jgi:hypothetical protein
MDMFVLLIALPSVCADKAPHRVFRRAINEWSVDTITFNWGEKPSPWGTAEGPGYPSAILPLASLTRFPSLSRILSFRFVNSNTNDRLSDTDIPINLTFPTFCLHGILDE